MNEHQVMITETTYGGREELYDPEGIMDYGSLIYITLQRARSAREAIEIIKRRGAIRPTLTRRLRFRRRLRPGVRACI